MLGQRLTHWLTVKLRFALIEKLTLFVKARLKASAFVNCKTAFCINACKRLKPVTLRLRRFCSSRLHRESRFFRHFFLLQKKWPKMRFGCTFIPQNLRQCFGTLCIPPSPGFGGRSPSSFWFSRSHLFIASSPADTARLP